ncbi:hypothetical protein MGALJ_42190 [Mycobacterium gallinarum]|uniref:ZIP family metal transporter n=1 Tax=Mycobacterium gallinarum TaxID=39689 RepID=A0A9W4BB80_9MYCO|nr:hypothetical protein [Mycobacterium gallinarum]BBY94550.1 hypothetical protein MGALJ_42190 [Mycobacterium gallinarum]
MAPFKHSGEAEPGSSAAKSEKQPGPDGLRVHTEGARRGVGLALLAAAVVVGRFTAGQLSDPVLAVALAFAGGAVLASLADTLMPEAFEHGRPLNAFATAGGFFLSFILAG